MKTYYVIGAYFNNSDKNTKIVSVHRGSITELALLDVSSGTVEYYTMHDVFSQYFPHNVFFCDDKNKWVSKESLGIFFYVCNYDVMIPIGVTTNNKLLSVQLNWETTSFGDHVLYVKYALSENTNSSCFLDKPITLCPCIEAVVNTVERCSNRAAVLDSIRDKTYIYTLGNQLFKLPDNIINSVPLGFYLTVQGYFVFDSVTPKTSPNHSVCFLVVKRRIPDFITICVPFIYVFVPDFILTYACTSNCKTINIAVGSELRRFDVVPVYRASGTITTDKDIEIRVKKGSKYILPQSGAYDNPRIIIESNK